MRRIKQISVEGLFGMLNHVIPLQMEERITIVHGREWRWKNDHSPPAKRPF